MRCSIYCATVVVLTLLGSARAQSPDADARVLKLRQCSRNDCTYGVYDDIRMSNKPASKLDVSLPALTFGSNTSSNSSAPWKKSPYAVGATALAYRYDEELQDWVQTHRTPTTDRIADYAKLFGDLDFMSGPLGGLFLYGRLASDETAVRVSRISFEAILIGGLTTQIMKNSFRRPRPSGTTGEDPFDLPDIGVSFPSGHTTVAFAVATVIADEYGDDNIVPFLAYGLATLTGWSRINDNDHWTSDVIFGAFIGYIAAKTAIRYELGSDQPDSRLAVACPLMLRLRF